MIKARSNDGIALLESPDVITKPTMPKKRATKSDNNRKIPPSIHRKVYFALILQLIVLPDPFGTTLPVQAGAKLFRDQRWRFLIQN